MKTLCIIVDGRANVHVALTRAPDLLRRTLSAQTGSATLAWCGLPHVSVSGHATLARIHASLGIAGAGGTVCAGSLKTAVRTTVFECVVRPRLDAVVTRVRRTCRSAVRSITRQFQPKRIRF